LLSTFPKATTVKLKSMGRPALVKRKSTTSIRGGDRRDEDEDRARRPLPASAHSLWRFASAAARSRGIFSDAGGKKTRRPFGDNVIGHNVDDGIAEVESL